MNPQPSTWNFYPQFLTLNIEPFLKPDSLTLHPKLESLSPELPNPETLAPNPKTPLPNLNPKTLKVTKEGASGGFLLLAKPNPQAQILHPPS